MPHQRLHPAACPWDQGPEQSPLAGRFEKLAEDCKRSMEILKQAFARGLPTPTARFEQRTFSVIK